jgi:hypothetical protein
MVGGLEGVVAFTTLLTLVTWGAWLTLARIRVAPVAHALLASTLLFFTGEGTMQVQPIVALIAVVLLVALADKWIGAHP